MASFDRSSAGPTVSFSYQQTNRPTLLNRHSPTPAFEPTPKTSSLPSHRKPPTQESHIRLEQFPETNRVSNRKRARIFDNQPRHSMSVVRPVQMEVQANTPTKIIRVVEQVTPPPQQQSGLRPQEIAQLDQQIYRRILQKLSSSYISRQELTSKQQELALMKLEVERLQRCQQLTKENEQLYRRLVQQMQEGGSRLKRQEVGSTYKRQQGSNIYSLSRENKVAEALLRSSPYTHKQTPINGLSQQQQQHVIINKRRSPQKGPQPRSPMFVNQPIVLNTFNANSQQDSPGEPSRAITFKGHPKRIKQAQIDMYGIIRRKFVGIGQEEATTLPGRLGHINGKIERSIAERERRSRSKSRKKVVPVEWHSDYLLNRSDYLLNRSDYGLSRRIGKGIGLYSSTLY